MTSNTAPVPPPLPGAALAACGQPGATEQASQTLKPATIRFTPANGPGTDVRAFEPLLPMYMEERPNVKVELEVIPEGGREPACGRGGGRPRGREA